MDAFSSSPSARQCPVLTVALTVPRSLLHVVRLLCWRPPHCHRSTGRCHGCDRLAPRCLAVVMIPVGVGARGGAFARSPHRRSTVRDLARCDTNGSYGILSSSFSSNSESFNADDRGQNVRKAHASIPGSDPIDPLVSVELRMQHLAGCRLG